MFIVRKWRKRRKTIITKLDRTSFARIPEIITLQEAVIILGISEINLRKNAREGKIKAFEVGKLWRFYKSDLMNMY